MPIESGKLRVYVGKSRSGKTQKAMADLARFKYQLVWDCEGQYKATYRLRTIADLKRNLARYLKKLPGRAERICYTGRLDDFNQFCQLAFIWVRALAHYGQRSAIVFEETADVTSPGKAPEHYGILLRRGLKYGVELMCITQRPSESDKTSIGNANITHICAMKRDKDRKYMAEDTGVPIDVLQGLRANQDAGQFDFVHVDDGQGFYMTGQLTFPSGKPKFLLNSNKKPL